MPTPQYPSHKCKEPNYTGQQSCKELLECKSECESCLSKTKSCHNVTKLINVQVPAVVCQN